MHFSAAPGARAHYVIGMKALMMILVGLVMLATLGVLFAGLFTMTRGGDPMRSNALMRWRVILQGAALALVALMMLIAQG